MSKTYVDQINKASALASGLKQHLEEVKTYGVEQGELDRLETLIEEGGKLNDEAENLKAETKAKLQQANQRLMELKDLVSHLKRRVKPNIDITRWENFGIMDKR